jgi:hypothetical protein
VFFLTYGGLHFSETELLRMPTPRRKWYVERLRAQLDHEKKLAKG